MQATIRSRRGEVPVSAAAARECLQRSVTLAPPLCRHAGKRPAPSPSPAAATAVRHSTAPPPKLVYRLPLPSLIMNVTPKRSLCPLSPRPPTCTLRMYCRHHSGSNTRLLKRSTCEAGGGAVCVVCTF